MVYGYHLFLKEMSICFRFREEDMNLLSSWIQIHGLPPDCWNRNVLSILTTYLGTRFTWICLHMIESESSMLDFGGDRYI